MRNRIEEIKAKGFDIVHGKREETASHEGSTGYQPAVNDFAIDFNKIKIGAKALDDAVLNLGFLNKVNSRLADKETVLRAINNYDLKTMREISDFFYNFTS